jgi:hypothetical protein
MPDIPVDICIKNHGRYRVGTHDGKFYAKARYNSNWHTCVGAAGCVRPPHAARTHAAGVGSGVLMRPALRLTAHGRDLKLYDRADDALYGGIALRADAKNGGVQVRCAGLLDCTHACAAVGCGCMHCMRQPLLAGLPQACLPC